MKPIAVLISDLHFGLHTYEIAGEALRAAMWTATEYKIPLIIAGDLQDTKAVMRAEVVNKILDILKESSVPIFVMMGNHDKVNEKGEAHALNYLANLPAVTVISDLEAVQEIHPELWLLPYKSDTDELRRRLSFIREMSDLKPIVIMHQGFMGAHMGEYVVDKTSIDPSEVSDFTVISGHYHRHQTIGTVTYIGTPYTITFAEANDGPKGFQILNEDGSLTQIPLYLRKHVIVERNWQEVMTPIPELKPCDLLWMKVLGPASELDRLNKRDIGLKHLGHQNFKLDLITEDADVEVQPLTSQVPADLLDSMIDGSSEPNPMKLYLKNLWREVMYNADS